MQMAFFFLRQSARMASPLGRDAFIAMGFDMTTSTTDAEAIARIIDPGAHVESPPAPYLPMDEELFALRRKTALVQANAILSYLALRREAQEPVAWQYRYRPSGASEWSEWGDGKAPAMRGGTYDTEERPLYTAPPAPAGEVERLRAALTALLRDDDEVDDCEVCGGSGELTAMTTQSDRELVGCPTCISRERSRSARAALNGG